MAKLLAIGLLLCLFLACASADHGDSYIVVTMSTSLGVDVPATTTSITISVDEADAEEPAARQICNGCASDAEELRKDIGDYLRIPYNNVDIFDYSLDGFHDFVSRARIFESERDGAHVHAVTLAVELRDGVAAADPERGIELSRVGKVWIDSPASWSSSTATHVVVSAIAVLAGATLAVMM